jgi:phage shock protein A
MTTTNKDSLCKLAQADLDMFERIICKVGDDLVVSIARSFERMEERIDGMEARLYSRFADIEDALESRDAKTGRKSSAAPVQTAATPR